MRVMIKVVVSELMPVKLTHSKLTESLDAIEAWMLQESHYAELKRNGSIVDVDWSI
ncbi:hypothetical protein GMA8713_04171 [Grimontia marina]|uniref:Uncharacterized protein n=1 Tax=Grimontia marina TaxID=646534 RepID=A0A128FH64_9GAMM|nr:hypothetical protein GMA8713_04171 [Grimontia marina]